MKPSFRPIQLLSALSAIFALAHGGCTATVVPIGNDTSDAGPGADGGGGATCGTESCSSAQSCCDSADSNGVCAPHCVDGNACPMVACKSHADCLCPTGDVCCDAPDSNGICRPTCEQGSVCPLAACKVPPPPPPPGPSCGNASCASDELCCSNIACQKECTKTNVCPVYGVPCPAPGPDAGVGDSGSAETGPPTNACGTAICPSGDICCEGVPFAHPTCVHGQVCPL